MSLEAATYISQLTETNPVSSDQAKQGDDHIRLIKAALKATFPNASSPQYFRNMVAEVSSLTPANADAGKCYPVTASAGNVSINLPATPTDGVCFEFFKSDFSRFTVTIAGNGNLINGVSSVVAFKPFQKIRVQYFAAITGWIAEIDAAVETGTFIDNSDGTLQNAIIADGSKTLGNASSGADYLGNRYRQLFEHLYLAYADSVCPVSGGRSGSNQAAASADFAANKRITMPALNGYLRATQDNQGGTTAGRITSVVSGINGQVPGSVGGAQSVLVNRVNLENTSVTVQITDPGHTHVLNNGSLSTSSSAISPNATTSVVGTPVTPNIQSATTGITAAFNLNGNTTQQALNKMPPVFITKTHMAI